MAIAVGTVIGVGLLTGCAPSAPESSAPPASPSATPSESPAPSQAPAPAGIAATASTPSVTVVDAPDGQVVSTLANPAATGAPLTFLVVGEQPGWVHVRLPQRPNGSTGWIAADQVTLATLEYSLVASTTANTLTLSRGGTVVETYPVATGTGGTPTPTGEFYLTELLAPTNAGYGPFAFGLSAYSEVLTSFGGGPGQIGLHGTDDAASIGTAASHGCIRLSNEHITALSQILPLGTPITIE